jgi:lipoic acid synthetase
MKRWGRPVPEQLSHLVATSYSPARQEAASLLARDLSNVS